jgi:hypothetical protein
VGDRLYLSEDKMKCLIDVYLENDDDLLKEAKRKKWLSYFLVNGYKVTVRGGVFLIEKDVEFFNELEEILPELNPNEYIYGYTDDLIGDVWSENRLPASYPSLLRSSSATLEQHLEFLK